MKLYYHTGKNFGDAINPNVFNYFLGDYLDDDSTEVILGIGSILGLFKKPENCKKVYVFSSGYAKGADSTYGGKPQLDSDFEIICVRGKGTAEAIDISTKFAVADGALLLPITWPIRLSEDKKYKFSFMPHSGTLDVFENWDKVCNELGINLIDPRKDPDWVMKELMETEVLLAEAMHGAIIADAYRIPWIPIKTIATINEFKWKDYCESVMVEYSPFRTGSLYSQNFIQQVFVNKFPRFSFLSKFAGVIYLTYQNLVVKSKVKKQFTEVMNQKSFLSEDNILLERQNELLKKMEHLKSRIINR